MLKKASTLRRFLLPVLFLLIAASAALVWQQTSQHLTSVKHGANEYAHSLTRLLDVADILLTERNTATLELLKERVAELGSPALDGTLQLGSLTLPNLVLGRASLTSAADIVDAASLVSGGTVTLLVKSNNTFFRVATNLRYADGSSAAGSKLALDSEIIGLLIAGKSFQGFANILKQPYLVRYEPILDKSGTPIGAWGVGQKLDILAMQQVLENSRYLASGFAAILDDQNQARFLSGHAPRATISHFLQSPPAGWIISEEIYAPWHFKAVVAYPKAEAYQASWSNSITLISAAILLGILLIALMLWQLKRLIIDPIGGDPARAIAIVQRITEGDLEHDGQDARPGTLMANVISMRQKLRRVLRALQKNAEGLRLSASVFEHAHDGIFITNANSCIVEVNPAFTKISGYTREEAIGKTPAELNFACNEPRFFDYLWQNAASTGNWKGESQNRRKSGETYSASLDLLVVHNEQQQVSHYLGVFSDITSDIVHRESLEHMAYHDPLTQLPNRTLLADRLQQALAHAQRLQEILAVCYFDLDNFKQINDQHGHAIGDQLLVQLAGRIRTSLRESDTIARMGGDEFVLLLSGLSSIEECNLALDRLLEVINRPLTVDNISAQVSASIGYTIFPADNSTADTLLRHADLAMYQVKLNGGQNYHLFDAEHDRFTRDQRQERDRVERALQEGEMRLFYQPKVNMLHGQVVGMEALIRWQHPQLGLRSPNDFLPQIEHTDLIITLGEWVIQHALHNMQQWQRQGLQLPVSVNISARHLMQPNFAIRLARLLSMFPDLNPRMLELEITETAVIEDIAGVTQIMINCKMLGVTFALDDFGVGYSSLTYLRRLPIDIIKIDQSFVRDMLHDSGDLALIAGIISLSREFNRNVIAEGVETAEHGVQLLRMGCSIAQGYGIARPMSEDQVRQWVANYQPEQEWKKVNWRSMH